MSLEDMNYILLETNFQRLNCDFHLQKRFSEAQHSPMFFASYYLLSYSFLLFFNTVVVDFSSYKINNNNIIIIIINFQYEIIDK
jgi:hypothetical protein